MSIVLFIEDDIMQGGEYQVLKSINWNHTSFDVMCIETEATNRPAGYANLIIDYLAERGYRNVTGQVGRNTCELNLLYCIDL